MNGYKRPALCTGFVVFAWLTFIGSALVMGSTGAIGAGLAGVLCGLLLLGMAEIINALSVVAYASQETLLELIRQRPTT